MPSNPHRITEHRYETRRRSYRNRSYGGGRRRRDFYDGDTVSNQTLCDAIAGTCFGILLIIGATFALFFSERHYIDTLEDINYIRSNVVSVPNPQNSATNVLRVMTALPDVPASWEDSIVSTPLYLQGTLMIAGVANVRDDAMGVSWEGVALLRQVEMFQWTERKHETKRPLRRQPGQRRDETTYEIETTYEYNEKWSDVWNDPGKFKYPEQHYNPAKTWFVDNRGKKEILTQATVLMQPGTHTTGAAAAGQGDYALQIEVPRGMFRNQIVRRADQSRWRDITSNINEKFRLSGWSMRDGYLYQKNLDASPEPGQTKPNIGDIRVRYKILDVRDNFASFLGTAVAKGRGDNYVLDEWESWKKQKFSYLSLGRVGLGSIIEEFESSNTMTLYVLRGLTAGCMIIGFLLLGSIVNWILSWIPLCGGFLGSLWSLAAIVVGVVFWCLVFGIAWFVARIDVAIACLVGIIGFIIGMQWYAREKESSENDAAFDRFEPTAPSMANMNNTQTARGRYGPVPTAPPEEDISYDDWKNRREGETQTM